MATLTTALMATFRLILASWLALPAFFYFSTHYTEQFQAATPWPATRALIAAVDGLFFLPYSEERYNNEL